MQRSDPILRQPQRCRCSLLVHFHDAGSSTCFQRPPAYHPRRLPSVPHIVLLVHQLPHMWLLVDWNLCALKLPCRDFPPPLWGLRGPCRNAPHVLFMKLLHHFLLKAALHLILHRHRTWKGPYPLCGAWCLHSQTRFFSQSRWMEKLRGKKKEAEGIDRQSRTRGGVVEGEDEDIRERRVFRKAAFKFWLHRWQRSGSSTISMAQAATHLSHSHVWAHNPFAANHSDVPILSFSRGLRMASLACYPSMGLKNSISTQVCFGSFKPVPRNCLHPGRLTWNLRIRPSKSLERKIIFQTFIFRFYVNLRECAGRFFHLETRRLGEPSTSTTHKFITYLIGDSLYVHWLYVHLDYP